MDAPRKGHFTMAKGRDHESVRPLKLIPKGNHVAWAFNAMIGENQQLVTNEPVEFEK